MYIKSTMILSLLIITLSCKKNEPGKATGGNNIPVATLPPDNCGRKLYALSGQTNTDYRYIPISINNINSSGTPAYVAAFDTGSLYSNQGVFAGDDYCVLMPYQFAGGSANNTTLRLVNINTGIVTNIPLANNTHTGLSYNTVTHTFWCIGYADDHYPDTLVSFKLNNGSISNYTQFALSDYAWTSPPQLAIDEQHNRIYTIITNVSNGGSRIYRYEAGTLTQLNYGPVKYLMGIKYVPANNSLLAIEDRIPPANPELLQIDADNGNLADLGTLPGWLSNECYSVAFDACSNRYYVAGTAPAGQSIIHKLFVYDLALHQVADITTQDICQAIAIKP